MLLTENIVVRYREWRDRKQEPDLVPRLRRLWKMAPVEPAPQPHGSRLLDLRHRAPLAGSRGA